MLSLEEIMKQRDEAIQNISYETNVGNNSSVPEYKEDNSSIDKYLNERNDEKKNYTFENNKEKEKYFLEFEDKRILINQDGCLECIPPILVFKNKLGETPQPIPYICDNFIQSTDKIFDSTLLFVVEIGDKTFTYNYGNKGYMYETDVLYDERFEALNIKQKLKNKYIKFSISSDSCHKVIFAYNEEDKCLTFEQAHFRMIRDELYKEMYG